ncbi:MAG: class I SAM-dependent methyltransferase, partial [Acidobacteriota bacterium]|nr:class I SAM-dependent methyltransferase [Acidobacteriota bacterium]
NGFHHFAPAAARSVLECAVKARQPIGIFEIPDRRLATIIPLLFTPLFVAMATPFIRPFQWQRLIWTYLLPLVPVTCWWDGLVSQFRAYTVPELLELTQGLDDYDWQAARVAINGNRGYLTYLLGFPKTRRAADNLASAHSK